jgi:hypothetical protein
MINDVTDALSPTRVEDTIEIELPTRNWNLIETELPRSMKSNKELVPPILAGPETETAEPILKNKCIHRQTAT